ncbi:MAG: hypothetical protein M0R30_08930 [Methanoregula sp.]|uniref:hypothetical protein n=1 Tax=Methanoregula sp. TaxID=2052170 RepID=UPI0025F7DDCC|nr:hypothetical protein [Methanoregula sp.]MCK9631756.1 hypothetical protein [Methanoregula sp.]
MVRRDNNCGYSFHGKAYAHLIDSIGERCTEKSLSVRSIATPYSRLVGDKAYFSPVSYNQLATIIFVIRQLLYTFRGREIALEWENTYRVNLWCQILDKATPKCIIGILPDKYLCQAGKIKKIPVYDLQHGVIADNHPLYGEKYQVNSRTDALPDGYLCWNEQSVITISKWAKYKSIRVINVGNPWFLRFIRNNPEDLLVHEAITDEYKNEDTRPCIVVTLEWGLERYYLEGNFNGVMVSALETVILDTAKLYNWILRLHPVHLRGSEKDMVLNYLRKTFGTEEAQRWLISSEMPLPILLRGTDLHISDISSVVIEAAWMGIRSGLLNQNLNHGGKFENYYSYERCLGMAEVLPQDPEIIKKWINDTLAKGRGESTLNDSGQNLDFFIDEIAEKTA